MAEEIRETDAEKSRPLAVIYFRPEAGQEMKDLAARIRNDGGRTVLVYSHLVKDESHVNDGAKACLIQKNAPGAQRVAELYRKFGQEGVEIHFLNDDGSAYYEEPPKHEDTSSKSGSTAKSSTRKKTTSSTSAPAETDSVPDIDGPAVSEPAE